MKWVLIVLLLVGCSYCIDETDCQKCSGECVGDSVVTCSDHSGDFECVCDEGKCKKVTVICFQTGSVIITGARSEIQINHVYNDILKIDLICKYHNL